MNWKTLQNIKFSRPKYQQWWVWETLMQLHLSHCLSPSLTGSACLANCAEDSTIVKILLINTHTESKSFLRLNFTGKKDLNSLHKLKGHPQLSFMKKTIKGDTGKVLWKKVSHDCFFPSSPSFWLRASKINTITSFNYYKEQSHLNSQWMRTGKETHDSL